MSNKGSQFERDICKQLSLWWTKGENDDVFWRSASSGGRATQRKKQGKKTFGQDGDVQATNPIGQRLIDVTVIEIKKGYNKSTLVDLLDKGSKNAKQQYEKWFEKIEQESKDAGAFAWMLIHKRDRREALVFIPIRLWLKFSLKNDWFPNIDPLVSFYREDDELRGMQLNTFLQNTDPLQIKRIARSIGK